MANEMQRGLDFDKSIREMTDRGLLEFTAREVYTHGKRITTLENRSNKTFGAVGGIAGFIGIVIGAVINYFVRNTTH